MIVFSRFIFPPNLSPSEKVDFCQKVIEKHRQEARVLRKDTASYQRQISKLEQELLRWQEKYQHEKEETGRLREENGILKKDKEKLEREIERLTKTNSRYQVSLFDSGNFKSPTNEESKVKGGQLNHPDTNREGQTNFPGYDTYPRKRIYAKSCGHCGNNLPRTDSFKQKVLLDIVIKPEVIQMILESERQWCGRCKLEVVARDPSSLPFTEYGLNTYLVVMILRFKAHCSLLTTSKVIKISFGLTLSKSDISNMLKMAANYLGSQYELLKQAVRAGDVIYADETGWLVRGQRAWMWIMANEQATAYVAAESRGKGIAHDLYGNSQSYCMTDGLKSYLNIIPPHKHCYCWAHMLRFAFEETIHSKKDSMSIHLRDELVRIYHIKINHPEYSKEQLEQVLTERVDKLLSLKSDDTSFNNILKRLKDQKDGLIKSLLETDSGTNNLAERELRELVLSRKISYGSDTYTGMQTTAILSSVIQTLGRDKQKDLLTELTLNLQIGIHEKYSQYIHIPYLDTS